MMKKFFLVLSLLVILTSCSSTLEDDQDDLKKGLNYLETDLLMNESVLWYGRHHLENEQVYFYYPSTGFKTTFIGSAINITLSLEDKNSDIYFSLAKDGASLLDGEVLVLSEATQTFSITFESYQEHTIELVKRSEPRDGVTSLLSLETNGEFINTVVPEHNGPHFLIIGASGISGNGALGEPWQSRTTANSSSLHSFGYLTANRFGGSYEFVSNSGWGLLFGYNDPSGETNIMKAYEYIGIDANQEIVDVPYEDKVVPDIIIVNIGGNDYSSVINRLIGFERENKIKEFKQAVAEFIYTLREDAPKAHIFWTMTEGSQNGQAAQSVIDLLPAEHKEYVHMVVIYGVGEQGPVGGNNHASYQTHQASTERLVEAIELYTNIRIKE